MNAHYTCELLQSADALQAALADWQRLERASSQPAPGFQTSGWNLAWMQALAGDAPHAAPCALLVRDGAGEPVLLWPLMRERYPLQMEVFTWLSDPYGQYGDVLTTLREDALMAAMHVALATLRTLGGDLVRLRHVRADAACAPFLREVFRATQDDCAAPWLDLSAFASVEAYEKRFNREQRRRRRKIGKKLKQLTGAEPTLRLMDEPREIRAAMDRVLECKRQWLKEKGLVSRALFSGHARAFLHALVEHLPPAPRADADTPALALSVLEAEGRQLSWEVGLRFRRRHYAWLTAHEPEFTRHSIGRLHMYLAQMQALRDGVKAYDLLVPDAPHKQSWSSHKTPVRNYFLPLSLRGRLLGATYLNHLRPFARDVYNRMPPQLRRLLRISEMVDHDNGMG